MTKKRGGRSTSTAARSGIIAEQIAATITRWVGSGTAFGLAVAAVVIWGAVGPIFGWSDTWQLVINTSTTIVTFLMVFLIQRSQNKDGLAMQLKLNELVAALHGASNRLIDIEDLSEQELRTLQAHYRKLVEMARNESDLTESHSVEEAESRHQEKRRHRSA